jgi:GDP-L-fucose synthase
LSYSQPVNLGGGKEVSIKELVAMITRLTGFAGQIVWDTTKPNGQPRRSLETSRAKRVFGFEAQVGLAEGLRQTIDWYVAQQHRSA